MSIRSRPAESFCGTHHDLTMQFVNHALYRLLRSSPIFKEQAYSIAFGANLNKFYFRQIFIKRKTHSITFGANPNPLHFLMSFIKKEDYSLTFAPNLNSFHFLLIFIKTREDIFVAAARKEFEYMIKNHLLKSCK